MTRSQIAWTLYAAGVAFCAVGVAVQTMSLAPFFGFCGVGLIIAGAIHAMQGRTIIDADTDYPEPF